MRCGLIAALGCVVCACAARAVTVSAEVGNDPAIAFAAKDLERLLKGVSGRIALRTDPSMSAEAWRFAVAADGTFEIWGRDGMGVSYGVSTYLERHCGVAWLTPDTEIVPCFAGFVLPKPVGTGRPVIGYREMWQSDGADKTWRLRNKESRRALFNVGIGMGSPRDNHTLVQYGAALRKAHPEFFGTRRAVSGDVCQQVCMSDETTRDFIAEEMCRYIEKDRAALVGKPRYLTPVVYDLSQPDGVGGGCFCPSCKALVEAAGGTYAGANLAFVNAVAERVGRRYPDVTIQTFAYGDTQTPPTNDVRYADNVNVRYCRSWIFRPLLATTENGQMLKAWSRHAAHLGIWSYWSFCRGSAFPLMEPPKDIQDEMRFCRDCGVSRYFLQTDRALNNSFFFLKNWLFLKLAEDPDRDAAQLTDLFMKGVYGAAAKPMSDYLSHLLKVQEPTRAFLNRDFFEKANVWLDESERLVADDARALRHVHAERVMVDRSMYENLAQLRGQGFACDAAAVARRFADNVREQVRNWGAFSKDERIKRLAAAEAEARLYARYPIPVPERFAGKDVEDIHWNRCCGARSVTVDDLDACAGVAFYNGRDDVHKLPFSCGFYNRQTQKGGSISFKTSADVPQDEKFHLYKLGRGEVFGGMYLTYDPSWENRYYVSCPGIIPEEWDIWLSMKFQGPAFVKGSTKDNRVLVDRLLYVKDAAEPPSQGERK